MTRRSRYVDGRDVPEPPEWHNAPRARVTTPADFIVGCAGSLWSVLPTNPAAETHLREHVGDEAQWYGSALIVEPRYMDDLTAALRDAGFVVRP